MYYIKINMKNSIFIITKYFYHISIVVLFILYLFPGSLIGYFLYGDYGKQPDLVSNPIGNSINHLIYFMWLTILASIIGKKIKNFFYNIFFIFLISILLELLHIVIPNRAFEYNDLFANFIGALIGLSIYKIFSCLKN